MFNIKLRGQILAGYAVPLILSSVIAALVFSNVRRVAQLTEQIENSQELVDGLGVATLHVMRMERSMRGYLVNGKERHQQGFETGAESFKQAVRSLETRIAATSNPEQIRRFQEYLQQSKQLEAVERKMVALAKEGQLDAAVELFSTDTSSELIREVQAEYEEFVRQERATLAAKQTATQAALDSLSTLAIWGTAIASLLALWIGSQIAAFVRKRIDRSVGAIAVSSTEIAATAEEQERIAAQQATSVTQTTTSMNELNASSQACAERAESAAARARQILTLVDSQMRAQPAYRGAGSEEWLVPSQAAIANGSSLKGKVGQIADQIVSLSEQIRQINAIANTVSNIANQTNILALNAAVEAVRAGERGKGFGVVASEIRKLADQSLACAERINALVENIHAATNAAVLATEEGTKTADSVAQAIEEIVTSTSQISLSAREQTIAIQQVLDAMNALNHVARETASGVAQVKVGTEKLNDAAQNLRAIV